MAFQAGEKVTISYLEIYLVPWIENRHLKPYLLGERSAVKIPNRRSNRDVENCPDS